MGIGDCEWFMRGAGWGEGLLYCMAGELWASVFGLAIVKSSLALSVPGKTGVGTTVGLVGTSGM